MYVIKLRGKQINLLRNKARSHEDLWPNGGIAPRILISTLNKVEWSVSSPDCFTLWQVFQYFDLGGTLEIIFQVSGNPCTKIIER
jgi:hypothetical protein